MTQIILNQTATRDWQIIARSTSCADAEDVVLAEFNLEATAPNSMARAAMVMAIGQATVGLNVDRGGIIIRALSIQDEHKMRASVAIAGGSVIVYS